MNNFTYHAPTKMIYQEGAENLAGKMLKEYGAKKVLIHYGGGSVIRTGLLDRVQKSIEEVGIPFVTLGGVVPNPLLSKVYEGVDICKKENADFILAVGGGSTLDSAKAIGMGVCYDGDVWDLFDWKVEPTGCLPIATVMTIAATGSEMSNSGVITKDEGMLKRHIGCEEALCKFALMNPELTKTLPDYQTASGCVDVLMHTMERYFNSGDNLDITDEIAEGLMRATIKHTKILKETPEDTTARWNVMWAGSLSHNGLTDCGTNGGDWSVHGIEHELGGMFDVAHGAGLSAIWGSWARYVIDIIPHRFAKFGISVLGVAPCNTEEETALKSIETMEAFYRFIEMPTTLTELGISPTDDEILKMSESATYFGRRLLGTVKPLDKKDIANILFAAR